jgi:glycosyltransferase involved in cell wall biosynthesis
MAAAKAVVSTSVGAEGLDVAHDRDILLADTPDTFADAVIRVLNDRIARRRLEDAALATASRYDWSAVAEALGAVLLGVVQSSSAHKAIA